MTRLLDGFVGQRTGPLLPRWPAGWARRRLAGRNAFPSDLVLEAKRERADPHLPSIGQKGFDLFKAVKELQPLGAGSKFAGCLWPAQEQHAK